MNWPTCSLRSRETVRRDLTLLSDEVLRKIHGGAVHFQTARKAWRMIGWPRRETGKDGDRAPRCRTVRGLAQMQHLHRCRDDHQLLRGSAGKSRGAFAVITNSVVIAAELWNAAHGVMSTCSAASISAMGRRCSDHWLSSRSAPCTLTMWC